MNTVIYMIAFALVVYATGAGMNRSLSIGKWSEDSRLALSIMFLVFEAIVLSIVH